MRARTLIGAGLAVALAAGIGAYSYTALAQGGPGYGMMGGYGPGGGYGPDWHMRGWGPGGGAGYGPGYHMRGWGGGSGAGQWNCPAFGQGDQPGQALNLTTDDVKARMERWLTWRGNSRLKVGEVKEKDADTITADVVTKENSLVERFIVDRRTGFFRRDNS